MTTRRLRTSLDAAEDVVRREEQRRRRAGNERAGKAFAGRLREILVELTADLNERTAGECGYATLVGRLEHHAGMTDKEGTALLKAIRRHEQAYRDHLEACR